MLKFVTVLALFVASVAVAKPYPFAVSIKSNITSKEIVAFNNGTVPVHVSLSIVENVNTKLVPNISRDMIFTVSPKSLTKLTTAYPVYENRAFTFKYRYLYQFGDPTAEHDDSIVYRLPFPNGNSFLVKASSEAQGSSLIKRANALDVHMPEGTPVLAARPGKVFDVKSPTDGSDIYKASQFGNYVLISHSDGTWAEYGWLSDVNVRPGDTIAEGQQIGLSGRDQRSPQPALHFAVIKNLGGMNTQSLKFNWSHSGGVTPAQSQATYLSPDVRTVDMLLSQKDAQYQQHFDLPMSERGKGGAYTMTSKSAGSFLTEENNPGRTSPRRIFIVAILITLSASIFVYGWFAARPERKVEVANILPGKSGQSNDGRGKQDKIFNQYQSGTRLSSGLKLEKVEGLKPSGFIDFLVSIFATNSPPLILKDADGSPRAIVARSLRSAKKAGLTLPVILLNKDATLDEVESVSKATLALEKSSDSTASTASTAA